MSEPSNSWLPNQREKQLLKRAFGILATFTLLTVAAGWTAMYLIQRKLPIIVPKIVGLDETQAERILGSKGLDLKIVKSQYDEHVPKDLIRSQNPKANHYLRRGDTVEAILSKGNPRVQVTSVMGLSSAQAKIALAGDRLKPGRESLIVTRSDPPDAVLAQVPAPGEWVDSFTEVDLLVSAGPEEPDYVMPDLENQPLESAFKHLRPAGITVEKIRNEVRDDLPSQTILAQSPPPGSRIKRKDGISLTVSAKSSDLDLKTRYARIHYDMPAAGPPQRLQIDVFDGSGTRTLYNRMESPGERVELGFSVTGKASAQVYLNQEFVKEIPIE